jgi:hypothetical protein
MKNLEDQEKSLISKNSSLKSSLDIISQIKTRNSAVDPKFDLKLIDT